MKSAKHVALLAATMSLLAFVAPSAHADPSNVSAVGSDLLLTEVGGVDITSTITRRASDGTGALLFVINAQLGRVSQGGGKIGVASTQKMTIRGRDVVKTIVWDITTPNAPAVVAKATYTLKKGDRAIGCGSQVELLGVSSAGEFVVRTGKRERHSKRKTRCTFQYLVEKRRAKTRSRDRVVVTAIGTKKTVIETRVTSESNPDELPLDDAPAAEAAGSHLVDWTSSKLSLREIKKNAKPKIFKFARGVTPMSVDLSESGQVLAAGVSEDRKGFLISGGTRADLPIQFSGESYLCGDRIVEIARSPIVVDGKITNELAALEWNLQGNLLKKTSIGKDHFAPAFSCSASDAHLIRQTVPAKRAELISFKLG